jgi:phage gp46-like protein
MTDIRLISKATLENTIADWLLQPDGTLDETEELATLVKVALMTDRRADGGEILPDPDSTDRRGWWGDYEAEPIWDGWPVGTKNWVLLRNPIIDRFSLEGDTVSRAEQYTREAVAPLVQRRYCTRIDVFAERVGIDRIDVFVRIYRGPLPEIELQFKDLWTEIREA